jgi:hypothetical protein
VGVRDAWARLPAVGRARRWIGEGQVRLADPVDRVLVGDVLLCCASCGLKASTACLVQVKVATDQQCALARRHSEIAFNAARRKRSTAFKASERVAVAHSRNVPSARDGGLTRRR